MKNLMKRILTSKLVHLLTLMMVAVGMQAQERLYDLNVNNALGNYEEYLRSIPMSSRAAGDTLDLPFFDDFSEPFTRLRLYGDVWPNSDRWIGNTVYINNHMAINPISQGVATFDGLDEKGNAYNFGFSLSALSDSLVSKCLRLEGAADTVVLSFYYQAQGLGNAPEEEDRLIVEFKDTSGTWNQVWEAEGYILEDFDFRRAMIPVTDTAYLFDGFQFRFMNYASLSGNVDHWHVDYVELDAGRSLADTIYKDVSHLSQVSFLPEQFQYRTSSVSLLKEYSAMPWSHYKADSIGSFGDTAYIALRNNDSTELQTSFQLEVYDHEGNLKNNFFGGEGRVFPFRICDNVIVGSCNEGTSSNLTSNLDTVMSNFPTDESVEMTDDSTFFELRYVLGVNDSYALNNMRVVKQEFYNYYAYDDGTAEAAYGLGELENVGRVAVKYETKHNTVDNITAIQLYLNPVEFDLSQELVQLAVWDGAEEPDGVLWMSDPLFLDYSTRNNPFHHYKIEEEVPISPGQNVWVGWIQQPATNLKFSVGFDKRTDSSNKAYYNLGSTWNQSSIPGSIMIRPSFGEPYDWVDVEEESIVQQLSIYPNPSTGTVYIQEQFSGQLSSASIQVFDLSGRVVHDQTGYSSALDLYNLNKGVYILRIDTETTSFTNRLVLQ